MPLTQVQSGLLESGAALNNIGAGNITPAFLNTQAQYTGFKNRLINGDMTIDQRNNGSSITNPGNNIYTVDRWLINTTFTGSVGRNLGGVTPPAGFNNYLGMSVGAAGQPVTNYSFRQIIEGFNSADLRWGTANAQPVTLSFWVRSSLTGTFGGSIQNEAGNRSYPFGYTIAAANTWQQVTVTIPGDTTGTWVGATNGYGMQLTISYGAAAARQGPAGAWAAADYRSVTGQVDLVTNNGATFYITGVQLEKGSTATSFDYLPYGTELQLCQRYFERSYNEGVATGTGLADGWYGFAAPTTSTECNALITFKVSKRVSPTMVVYNAVSGASGAAYRVTDAVSVGITLARIGQNNVGVAYTASGNINTYYYHWTASSEL